MPDPTAILTDFMLPAPLAAAGTMLLGLSLALVSDSAGLAVFRRREGIFRALYFFSGLLVLAWLILLFGICGIASQRVLQGGGVVVILAAVAAAWQRRREFMKTIGRPGRLKERIWPVLLTCVLLLIALSPPTDADSLDYHLGVPVAILRTGGLDFDTFQLHYQMFGFGEMLNLFGLANGCASFGAFVQLLSLLFLGIAYRSFVGGRAAGLASMLLLGTPVLIALLSGSKHLLTGACCTAVCFLYLQKYGRTAAVRSLLPAISALVFAAGIKYSFLISGLLLAVYAVVQSRNKRVLASLSVAGLGTLFGGPLFLFKLYRFHDPVPPFGAGMSGGDPVVTWFCGFIRDYTESAFPFPLSVLVPAHFGAVSSVLGWTFVILFAGLIVCFRSYKTEVVMIAALCVLTLLLGQATSRFFIEPLLWELPLWLRVSGRYSWGKIVTRVGLLQFFVTLPLSLYLAWSLGRGIVSRSQQDAVMARNGSFYEAAKWVNAVVPHGGVLLTDIRSRSLLAMPVFPIEYRYARNAGREQLRVVDSLLQTRYDVQYIAVIDPDIWFVQKYCGALIAGPEFFEHATRNPFNRGRFRMVIYRAKDVAGVR